MRIALLEDDPHVARLISLWLKELGHSCAIYADGASFYKGVGRESYDILLLDWTLPDTTADKVLHWLRKERRMNVPIMVVTARDREEDIVVGLEAGADDYLVKPVRRAEFGARIGALARRATRFAGERTQIELAPFRIDTAARCVERNGAAVALNNKEFELAVFLFENVDRLISRGHILERIWGLAPDVDTRTVDTHISRLRKKLGLGPETGWRVSSVQGFGYRLERISPGAEDA